jgi:hypothetical protein
LDLAECIGERVHQANSFGIASHGAGQKRECILRRNDVQPQHAGRFGVHLHNAIGPMVRVSRSASHDAPASPDFALYEAATAGRSPRRIYQRLLRFSQGKAALAASVCKAR